MDKPIVGQIRFVKRPHHHFDGTTVKILQQYLETPRADDYDGPTTHTWQDVPCVDAAGEQSR